MFFTNHLWPSWGWLIVGFTTLSIIIIHCLYKGTYSHHIPLIHLNPSFCCGKYRMELLLRSLAHGMFRALFHFLHNSWQKEGSEGCTRKRLWHMGQSENGPMVYAAGTQKNEILTGLLAPDFSDKPFLQHTHWIETHGASGFGVKCQAKIWPILKWGKLKLKCA